MAKFDAYVIGRKLSQIVERKTLDAVQRQADKLQDVAEDAQGVFFSMLASKIIGQSEPPELKSTAGYYGEDWVELDESYKQRRYREKGIGFDSFYEYSGGLKASLNRSKAKNAFGTAVLTIDEIGTYRKQLVRVTNNRARIISTNKPIAVDKVKDKRYAVTVDFFPKVTENIFSNSFVKHLGNYTSAPIALKLTNWRGKELRPVIRPYINWWLNVYSKQQLKRALR